MNALSEIKGVWFVYDGHCSICTYAAEALRIKEVYGCVHTLDARVSEPNPLMQEINRRGLDLDEGMVVYVDGQFYHGEEALRFIAKYGETKNLFMSLCKGIFWSDTLSRFAYPWLRGIRNWLLRQRNVDRIDNLNMKNEPIFKSIFGDSWDALPPVMKKHYSNRPYRREQIIVNGVLDVMCKPPLLWLSPIMNLLGQIPAYNESNVPVTVYFESDQNTKAFHFNRIFNFSKGRPYKFKSRMLQIKDNEVAEIMRFRLGWKMRYSWDGEQVILSHSGYVLYLLGYFIPLPLTFLMGAGYAQERPTGDNSFDMETHIVHPYWGKVYEYKGRFEVSH